VPTTQPAYDKDKFKELILYIARKSEDDPKYGAAKLAKLMYFIDFEAYGALGASVTGARYHLIARGPAPKALKPVRDEMATADPPEIRIRPVPSGGARDQERVEALRDPDTSVFSNDERRLIDEVIERYKPLNGSEISAKAHEEIGVRLAAEREEIPYGTVYLSNSPWTQEEIAYAQRRMKERGWARPAA